MNKLLAACLACLLPATAFAASGELWEVTSKTEMPGMSFAMPETTMQVCMGKGDASDPRKSTPPDKDCKITDIKKSGSKTTWKMRCDRNGEVMTGTGEITTTRNGYHGVSHVKGKSGGHNIDMTSRFSGKKLGKSCDTSKQPWPTSGSAQPAPQRPPAKSSSSEQNESRDSEDALKDGAKKLKGLFGF